MTTVGESISRIRNVLKAVKEDPFMTDRFIASITSKYAKLLIRRQDNENKLMKFQSLFEVLPCVELIEVDKIEACCSGIKSNCKIMRTKDKLPTILEGAYGPLFRSVTSIDGSIEMVKTYPGTYTAMTGSTNFKYNKTKYFWYLDGYMYFPNIEWEAVRIEGMWDGDIAFFKCDKSMQCKTMQEQQFRIPEFLFAEIEQMALKEILTTGQILTDGSDNQQNILR
jgi:hypothetical protein